MANNKHLTLSERIKIEKLLDQKFSFKAIGRELERDCTTISKEVKKHIKIKKSGAYGRIFNDCLLRYNCSYSYLCGDEHCRKSYCKYCLKCTSVCNDYVEEKCIKLSTAPYICNGCKKLRRCTLKKSIYTASYAQKQYELVLKESRIGITINETETKRLDEFISPLIRKGHSIHHICISNIDTIMCSEKTIYNYVDYNIFSARNIDLPRKVRYRPRKNSSKRFKVDKACRINRTYKDFLQYMNNNPDTPVVQMDTVEGKKGGKVLLTIHFLQTNFMLAYLRDSNTSKSVTNVFEALYNDLGSDIFKQLFTLELTDNGSEFSNPLAIEYNKQGDKRTMVFYCDPSAPFQKGAVENNHEMIRRIIPKGHSFDHLNQNDIDLMMNNINSYGRKILNNKSPYELFKLIHGINVLNTLNAQLIPPNEIILTPKLFKNR